MSEKRSWLAEYRTRGTKLRRSVNGTLIVVGIAALIAPGAAFVYVAQSDWFGEWAMRTMADGVVWLLKRKG